MNLFVVGLGLPADLRARVLRELRRTSRLYPLLEHDAIWQYAAGTGPLVASVATAPAAASPRVYLHEDPGGALLFDGLPLDPSRSIAAHRAPELWAAWDRLEGSLEGRFCIVRVTDGGKEIELLTDPLGVEQVFVHERAGASIVSNSAGLIQRAIGAREPDPLGVSTFLTMDFVGGDRTLRRDVRVIPAAQHWRWRASEPGWSRRRYWSFAAPGIEPVRSVDAALVADVAASLTSLLGTAASVNGIVNAPLSGGKDSRMLAAVLIAGGIPARYWTKGDPGGTDFHIGQQVAARYNLPHQLSNRPTQLELERDPTLDIAAEWETLSDEFVAQGDGMASLMYIGNIQGQPDRLDAIAVTLTGIFLEFARGALDRPIMYGPGASLERTSRFLPSVVIQPQRGLVSADAVQLVARHVRDTLRRLSEEGVRPKNLVQAFAIDEYARRWATTNPRQLAQTEDKVVVAMTRPFAEATLSITNVERRAERLHREVMRTLVPGLDEDPPFDQPWRSESPTVSPSTRLRSEAVARLPPRARIALVKLRHRVRPARVVRTVTSPYDEPAWIEANLPSIRELILARRDSPLWNYVDRPYMERLIDPRTPAQERARLQFPLFTSLSMFQFEEIERRLAVDDEALP